MRYLQFSIVFIIKSTHPIDALDTTHPAPINLSSIHQTIWKCEQRDTEQIVRPRTDKMKHKTDMTLTLQATASNSLLAPVTALGRLF